MEIRFRKSRAPEKSRKLGLAWARIVFLILFFAFTLAGCLIPSQDAMKKLSWPVQQQRTSESGEKSSEQTLIKPFIPPESERGSGENLPKEEESQSVQTKDRSVSEQPQAPSKPAETSTQSAPTQSEQKPSIRTWEDEKVKTLALELAKGLSAGSKMKMCYAVKKDEWWVILYEDTGTVFELKQYSWNREQNKLEPFLVFKTIPKDQIQEHLSSSEPDRACEVIETPRKED
jgi:hypothetical protein